MSDYCSLLLLRRLLWYWIIVILGELLLCRVVCFCRCCVPGRGRCEGMKRGYLYCGMGGVWAGMRQSSQQPQPPLTDLFSAPVPALSASEFIQPNPPVALTTAAAADSTAADLSSIFSAVAVLNVCFFSFRILNSSFK